MKKKHLLIVCLAIILALSSLYLAPQVIRGDIIPLAVLSGSMEPVMRVGDMVVVSKINPEDVTPGDIIVFKDPSGRKNVLITHRVIAFEFDEEGKEGFKTKGDAVEDPDQFVVKQEDVVGKPVFLIPSIGYLFGPKGSKNPLMWLLLVMLPAGLIIADEIKNIFRSPSKARKKEREKRRKERRAIRIVNYKRFLMIFLFSTILFGAVSLPSLTGSGYVTDINVGTLKIENREALPGVCIFNIINDPHGEISISPGYAVLPPKSDTEVEVEIMRDVHETDTGGSGLEHEDALITVSKSPYIMPIFWIDTLAKINPYLPGLVSSTIPPVILTLMLFPIWFHRRVKYKYKYRRHLFKKLKRRLLTATF